MFAVTVLSASGGSARAQVNVTTYHNDNARTGQFTQETTGKGGTRNKPETQVESITYGYFGPKASPYIAQSADFALER